MSATELATRNGNGRTPEAMFPVDSFREAAAHLRRPFTAEAVKFKVQATYPKEQPKAGIIVAYIDARLAVERLNLIVPHLWRDEYQSIGDRVLLCKLTVDEITRSDVGEGGVTKAGFSDALKRAAVKFGVGVSLYAIPKIHLTLAGGDLKSSRTREGESLVMTPKGEGTARAAYRGWLSEHGIEAFGEPLSHGDVEGAAGDVDAPDEMVVTDDAAVEPEIVYVDAAAVEELKAAAKGLKVQQIKLAFGAVGIGTANPFNVVEAFGRVPAAAGAVLAEQLAKIDRPAVAA